MVTPGIVNKNASQLHHSRGHKLVRQFWNMVRYYCCVSDSQTHSGSIDGVWGQRSNVALCPAGALLRPSPWKTPPLGWNRGRSEKETDRDRRSRSSWQDTEKRLSLTCQTRPVPAVGSNRKRNTAANQLYVEGVWYCTFTPIHHHALTFTHYGPVRKASINCRHTRVPHNTDQHPDNSPPSPLDTQYNVQYNIHTNLPASLAVSPGNIIYSDGNVYIYIRKPGLHSVTKVWKTMRWNKMENLLTCRRLYACNVNKRFICTYFQWPTSYKFVQIHIISRHTVDLVDGVSSVHMAVYLAVMQPRVSS